MSRQASPDGATDGVAAVERALAIVDAIAQRTDPITLADLSRVTGFYKSTLLRLIASLERACLVVRRADGRYALGPYAHTLGRAYEATYQLTESILPRLRSLTRFSRVFTVVWGITAPSATSLSALSSSVGMLVIER